MIFTKLLIIYKLTKYFTVKLNDETSSTLSKGGI